MKSLVNDRTKPKKVIEYVALLFIVACLTVCLAGCDRYYWDYDCNWICNEPYVELYQGCGSGKMVIDDIEYNFYTAQANDATSIELYFSEGGNGGKQSLLWSADTVLKDGKLYLTITEDTISDFEGKTLVFEQKMK